MVGTGRKVNFHLPGMFVFGRDERIYFDSEKKTAGALWRERRRILFADDCYY